MREWYRRVFERCRVRSLVYRLERVMKMRLMVELRRRRVLERERVECFYLLIFFDRSFSFFVGCVLRQQREKSVDD